MKNIFKKNQIIIAALAIMIIIAGYLNFSEKNNDDKTADVGTNESLDYDTYAETADDNILDGSTVTLNDDPNAVGLLDDASLESTESSDEVAAADGETSETASGETADEADADTDNEEVAQYDVSDTGEVVVDNKDAAEDDKTTAPGEAILVSKTIAPDYFANAKLEREQKRSISRETLMEIVNNKNVTEEEKKDAVNSILELTAEAKIENDTETLLEAKGFSDAVVIMSDSGDVDVIINTESVTEQDIAQVEDIVKRQTGVDSKKIRISPVVEEE